MSCPNCEKLRKEIDGLRQALMMKQTMMSGDLLAEGEEYHVIKVRKHKNQSGFAVVDDGGLR